MVSYLNKVLKHNIHVEVLSHLGTIFLFRKKVVYLIESGNLFLVTKGTKFCVYRINKNYDMRQFCHNISV